MKAHNWGTFAICFFNSGARREFQVTKSNSLGRDNQGNAKPHCCKWILGAPLTLL